MTVEFNVVFSSDCEYDQLNDFRGWLHDCLQEHLFVDHYRDLDIDIYYGAVVELLSFKEEE